MLGYQFVRRRPDNGCLIISSLIPAHQYLAAYYGHLITPGNRMMLTELAEEIAARHGVQACDKSLARLPNWHNQQ